MNRVFRIALAAATALATGALIAALRARQAERDHPPIGRFLDIGGVRLHYVETGGGPPLVLLHGNGAMIADFAISGVLDRLARRFRVIAIDRPGFGHSARPRPRQWTAQAQADLIRQALRRLDVGRAIVVGHSWGTLPALALALDHPGQVRALVLLAGYYFPTLRTDVAAFSILAAPGLGDLLNACVMPFVGWAVTRLVFRRLFAPAAVSARFAAEFPMALALRPSQITASAVDTELMPVSAAALAPRYGELTLPAVIMADRDDRIVDFASQSQRLSLSLRNAVLVPFSGAGHMLHHLTPDEVAAGVELAAFLSAAPAAAQPAEAAVNPAREGAAETAARDPAGW